MSRELLKQALYALKYHSIQTRPIDLTDETIEALRQELAKPEQESISTNDHLCAMLRQVHDVLACTALPMKRDPLDWLPKHAAGLYITHNDHKNVYYTIEDHYSIDDREWVSPEEKRKAIELDSVWELHWYPDTPIGSYKVAASSLEAIQKHIKEHGGAWRCLSLKMKTAHYGISRLSTGYLSRGWT